MLSDNIKKYRKAKNLSQDDLAAKIHVVRQTLSKWENSRSVPDADQLIQLATALDVSVNDLLGTNLEDQSNSENISIELAKANEQIAQYAAKHRIRMKTNKIRGAMIWLTFLAIAVIRFIGNPIIALSVSAILLSIVMYILYRNLTLLSQDFNGKSDTKILKLVTIVNACMLISVFLFIVMMKTGVLYLTELQKRWIVTAITFLIFLFTGIAAPKLPHNRHTGLRLPWTVANEKVWNVAHKILGIISIPLGLLYVFLGFYVDDIGRLSLIVLAIWIGLPSIISLLYSVQLIKHS